MFRSTGSYEPDRYRTLVVDLDEQFRSTGSYEPDLSSLLSSGMLTRFRSTGSYEPDLCRSGDGPTGGCFDPQALTSLTAGAVVSGLRTAGFDPQALTSLTRFQFGCYR